MMNRSLTSAVRPLANLRVSLMKSAVPARHFSASPARGLSAVFNQTENTELNEVLATIQDKIILPAYLPKKQRELVFNPKKRTFIQQNPVIIELDGLEHKFTTIDRFKEVPNSKKVFHDVIGLMKTKEDWDNIGTLLAGYKKAGIRLRREHYTKIIRLAGESKQSYSIIECAKQSQVTGFVLDKKEHLLQLLVSINNKIISPSGKENESAQALTWAELVLDLIQRPEHLQEEVQPYNRLHLDPIVRGLYLYTQASAAQAKQATEQPADELVQAVKENAETVSSLWTRHGFEDLNNSGVLVDINPFSPQNKQTRNSSDLSPNYYVLALAQNIKGIEMAQEIVGDAAKDLKPAAEALEQHLRDFVKTVYRDGWAKTYESVTGRMPDWAQSST
ncbi:hypothetical protein FZEAL_4189 [Fusarium zealandicum]|uniref:Uncharacterized protein n=1 Tax=Fusarium zealandicum TaxID=1053134 RepID=A0A8H4UM84_9HYPO|nr:hypothetical protein FZEAL_4189 [Fusarium zealandicum]